MAKVSVVVTTSNSKNALLATAESVLAQDHPDFELLVTDDGSSDGSGLEFLIRYGPDSSKAEPVWRASLREEAGTRTIQMTRGGIVIHYLHQIPAKGPSAARNRAIGHACGEFLAFAAAGDVWRPWKLSTQLELMEAQRHYNASVESPAVRRGRKPGPPRRPELTSVDFTEMLECPGLRLNGSLLRRTCLDPVAPPFDENLTVCEEYDFWLRLAGRHRIARLGEPMQIAAPLAVSNEWGLERFRVYALEKAYQGGHLDPVLRHRVAEELISQCDLLVEGYREQNNQERANFYDRKKKRFAQEVTKLDLSDPMYRGPRSGGRPLSGASV
jgi:glycosyltransferase involved in cell wall biosynthesis